MSTDDDFLRKFAAQIATALREKEDMPVEQQRQSQPTIEESVEDLYRSLVFDEPLVDNIPNLSIVASALSRELLSAPTELSMSEQTCSYALSNRLINGIIFLCNQNQTAAKKSDQKPTTGNDENESRDNETLQNLNKTDKPSHSTVHLAMAKLAFCIFIDIPLQCCRGDSSSERKFSKIRTLLGSFKATTISKDMRYDNDMFPNNKSKDTDLKIDVKDNNDTRKHDIHLSNASQQQQQQQIEEIWAAESDPSDYDYTEGDNGISEGNYQQEEMREGANTDWLDPKFLSKPDPNLTLQQAREAIGSLLQNASYTLLEPIFCLPQKDTSHYVSRLTQLVLVLLQPRKETPIDDCLLLDTSQNHVILNPLWILRDAATYYQSKMRSTTENYERSYLQVLQTLLAMDRAYLQDVGKLTTAKNEEEGLCVSSIVGLSSLSSWCAAQKNPTQKTLDTIIDVMNDLEHIVERGQQIYKKNLPHAIMPILETLSGIYYDRLANNNPATVPGYKSSVIPQTLLNSGFLRQILYALGNANDSDKPLSLDLLGFHHAVWGLCIAYPKIVGKYVFRFPGGSEIIRSYAIQLSCSAPQLCVECILWNVYGWHQCKDSSGSGVSLNISRKAGKSSTNASEKLTQDECREVCGKAWSGLCRMVKEALEDFNVNDDAMSKRVIQEWGRLLVFTSIPFVAQHFKAMVDSSLLDGISVVISNELSQKNERGVVKKKQEVTIDDEKNDKPSQKQKIIAQSHKLLKQYDLFFQGNSVSSSKTD